jgi:hypothetical protein
VLILDDNVVEPAASPYLDSPHVRLLAHSEQHHHFPVHLFLVEPSARHLIVQLQLEVSRVQTLKLAAKSSLLLCKLLSAADLCRLLDWGLLHISQNCSRVLVLLFSYFQILLVFGK